MGKVIHVMKGPSGPFLALTAFVLLMVLLPGMPETVVLGAGAANILDPRMVGVAVVTGLAARTWLHVLAGCGVATIIFLLTPHSSMIEGRPDITTLQIIGLWMFTSLLAMIVSLCVMATRRVISEDSIQDA
jgi:hypothetical protein